jgi:hypothetical protein
MTPPKRDIPWSNTYGIILRQLLFSDRAGRMLGIKLNALLEMGFQVPDELRDRFSTASVFLPATSIQTAFNELEDSHLWALNKWTNDI